MAEEASAGGVHATDPEPDVLPPVGPRRRPTGAPSRSEGGFPIPPMDLKVPPSPRLRRQPVASDGAAGRRAPDDAARPVIEGGRRCLTGHPPAGRGASRALLGPRQQRPAVRDSLLPAPAQGFGVTFAQIFRKVTTEQYPFEPKVTKPRYHGRHVLNRHPDGLEKCVGCELCAWACPADAIYVEGGDNTEEARFSPGERYGAVYQINYLRCIFCGLCIEACPTRSLTMSNDFELADDNRQDLIYTKEQLMAPLLPGMEQPPHPMRLGTTRRTTTCGVPGSARRGAEPVVGGAGRRPPATCGGGRDRRLLDPRPDRAGRGARHGAQPQRRPLGALAGQHHAGVRRLLRRPGGAVPRRGADHRLHRRDHDPLPVRADAGRPRLLGLVVETLRGQRVAAIVLGIGFAGLVGAGIAARHPRTCRPAGSARRRRRRQHPGDRRAAVHQVPARLRGHQRAADHRRGGRDGARPHRAGARQPADPEGAVAGPLPHRPAADAARPRVFRAGPTPSPSRRSCPTAGREDSLATGLEPQEPDQMPRPTGREQLGSRRRARHARPGSAGGGDR